MTKVLFPDVIVNGEIIPSTAVAAEAQNHPAPADKPGIAWRKAAQALAIRALLLQEAKARGIVATPAEPAPGRFETEEEALIRALLDAAVRPAPVTEEAIHAAWARNPDRFRSAPLWDVSHILCACDPRNPADREAAEVRAKTILARLDTDADSFARAARESDCPSKSEGGRLGQLGPGDTVPEFEAALTELPEGQTTPSPVLSRHGWHIIRMNAVAPGQVLPFETVRPRLSEALKEAAWARASREFVEGLGEAAVLTGVSLGPIDAGAGAQSRPAGPG